MSWYANTTIKQETPISKSGVVPEELNALVASGQDYATKERDEQLEVAKGAALRILVEGKLEAAEEISISLSGHANQGHEDVHGANEYIAVNVSVKKYREVPAVGE